MSDAAGTGALDLLSFGEALVDFFPERPGLPLRECERYVRHLGGAPANVAVGLGRLGVRVGLMTLVGPDDFGQFVRDRLAAEGVDVRGVGVHRTAKTGVTFVAVGPHGERSFLFFRHPSADQMIAAHDVDAALIGQSRVFHFGSSTLSREPARAATLHALEAAQKAGCLVSSDPNWRPHLWEDPAEAPVLVRRVLAGCHVVKVSDDELQPLFGTGDAEEGARMLRRLGVTLAIVTLGARGSYFDAPSGSGFVPGERVDVVDTTGAGDGFMAGLWAALLGDLEPSRPSTSPLAQGRLDGRPLAELPRAAFERACRRGNHVGAQVVTQLGATSGLPRTGDGAAK